MNEEVLKFLFKNELEIVFETVPSKDKTISTISVRKKVK